MKKVIVLFTLLTAGLCAYAQEVKIGYVNANEVLMQMPEISNIETAMAEYNAKNTEYLQTMYKEIQDKYAKFEQEKESMPEAIRRSEEESLQVLSERFQTTYQSLQEDSQKKQAELMQPVIEKLKAAITAVGARLKLTVVHDMSIGSVVYVGDKAVDITKDVKKELGII